MKHFITTILFCLPFFVYSQDPFDKEEMAMMAEFMFTINKDILKPDTCLFKEIDYVESDYFSELATESDIAVCLEIIKSTGSLEFAKDWNHLALFFKSNVSEKFSNEIDVRIGTDFVESDLRNNKGQVVGLAQVNSGNSSLSEIEHRTQIGFDSVSMEGITGTATYRLEFLTGYDRIELSPQDIGKKFMLNGCQITLLDIIENILILESECEEQADLKVVNFTADSKVIASYSWAKLSDMKKEDETVQVDGCFGSLSQTVYKSFYEMLANNPNIALEEFKALVDEKFFDEKNKNIKVVSMRQVGPFENKFMLYTPIFSTRDVTIAF